MRRPSLTAAEACRLAGSSGAHRHMIESGQLKAVVLAKDMSRAALVAVIKHGRGLKFGYLTAIKCENRLKKRGWNTAAYRATVGILKDIAKWRDEHDNN